MSAAAAAPAAGPAIRRAATNVHHTRTAPAIGESTNTPSSPPAATSGASSRENPGAHIGTYADRVSSDGWKPPGVNVFGASGHGTRSTSALVGWSEPDANASAINA